MRSRDHHQRLADFTGELLVLCPRCGACARDAQSPSGTPARRRLLCSGCGLIREWGESGTSRSWPSPGSVSELQLWLQTPCCGETLWFYNFEHLSFVEDWVRADLRERRPHPRWGWQSRALTNRLPGWMLAKKNREEVLRGIARLRDLASKTDRKF